MCRIPEGTIKDYPDAQGGIPNTSMQQVSGFAGKRGACMSTPDDWTPAWAKQAIWYQIFPSGSVTATRRANPTLADTAGASQHDLTSPWQVHPWTADWYALQPYETANGRGLAYNLIRRRYGGDLQGILDKLDYLQDLGVNALYLNPIFEITITSQIRRVAVPPCRSHAWARSRG